LDRYSLRVLYLCLMRAGIDKGMNPTLSGCSNGKEIGSGKTVSPTYPESILAEHKDGMRQSESDCCSISVRTSSFSLGKWFITILQSISAERLS